MFKRVNGTPAIKLFVEGVLERKRRDLEEIENVILESNQGHTSDLLTQLKTKEQAIKNEIYLFSRCLQPSQTT